VSVPFCREFAILCAVIVKKRTLNNVVVHWRHRKSRSLRSASLRVSRPYLPPSPNGLISPSRISYVTKTFAASSRLYRQTDHSEGDTGVWWMPSPSVGRMCAARPLIVGAFVCAGFVRTRETRKTSRTERARYANDAKNIPAKKNGAPGSAVRLRGVLVFAKRIGTSSFSNTFDSRDTVAALHERNVLWTSGRRWSETATFPDGLLFSILRTFVSVNVTKRQHPKGVVSARLNRVERIGFARRRTFDRK